jgi:hypothetical protein
VNTSKRKAIGAYYTPGDVTAYIVEMTILPWLLDAAARQCPRAFAAGGSAWGLLAAQPDRYIRDAVRHGVDRPLPRRRAAKPSPEIGLPTETWIEPGARRQRCGELRQRLQDGAVHTVNELVTLNLDIRCFVADVLAIRGERALVEAIRQALADIRVLDPTCGDGAFLVAALNALQDVAGICGERKREAFLRHNIFGIDLDDKAVRQCRRSLAPTSNGTPPALNIWHGEALAVELPAINGTGGFDVIIGNPPYIAAQRARFRANGQQTAQCPDVYAWILERSAELLRPGGRTGMIVPLSLAFSEDFAACRRLLFETYSTSWFASFGRIPSALFAFDIRVRNTIHLGHKEQSPARQYTTRLHRWFDRARPHLFALLDYGEFQPDCWDGRIPKLAGQLLEALERRMQESPVRLGDLLARGPTPHRLYFKKTAYNWLTFCRQLPPCFDARGRRRSQTQFDCLYFHEAWQCDAALLLLNGKWAFAFWCAVGDDFHVTRWTLADFPFGLNDLQPQQRRQVGRLARRLERAMTQALAFKRNAGKRVGTYNLARCRHITDQSDRLFAKLMGLEALWPEVELLYVQMVRTDFEPTRPKRGTALRAHTEAQSVSDLR